MFKILRYFMSYDVESDSGVSRGRKTVYVGIQAEKERETRKQYKNKTGAMRVSVARRSRCGVGYCCIGARMCIVECMNMCSLEAGSEGWDKELKRREGLIQVGRGN
jgi:hypothetical protein